MSPKRFFEVIDAEAWWTVLMRGMLLFLLGLYVMHAPVETLPHLIALFALVWTFDGLFLFIAWAHGDLGGLKYVVLRSIFTFAAGAFLLLDSHFAWVSRDILVYLGAFLALLLGAWEAGSGIKAACDCGSRIALPLGGSLYGLFGLLLILSPILPMTVFTLILGGLTSIIGVILGITAFRMRSLPV